LTGAAAQSAGSSYRAYRPFSGQLVSFERDFGRLTTLWRLVPTRCTSHPNVGRGFSTPVTQAHRQRAQSTSPPDVKMPPVGQRVAPERRCIRAERPCTRCRTNRNDGALEKHSPSIAQVRSEYSNRRREGCTVLPHGKDQHARAISRVNAKAKEEGAKGIKPFQPYVLRHTALTQLAEAGCDVFTLARIAGHSSITITQRYVHPQADAIERAFQRTTAAALPCFGPWESS
jgi:hypothetical protein